jgi:hypothetical protein
MMVSGAYVLVADVVNISYTAAFDRSAKNFWRNFKLPAIYIPKIIVGAVRTRTSPM